jgi:Putative zinc- or iron-chelating domain
MGEAKRRAAAIGRENPPITCIDPRTGEEYLSESRWGGSAAAFFQAYSNAASAAATAQREGKELPERKVPCGSCTACCWHPNIDVDPAADDLSRLSWEEREDGKCYLRKREDGACVHLGPQGCTVYEHRPQACRSLRLPDPQPLWGLG